MSIISGTLGRFAGTAMTEDDFIREHGPKSIQEVAEILSVDMSGFRTACHIIARAARFSCKSCGCTRSYFAVAANVDQAFYMCADCFDDRLRADWRRVQEAIELAVLGRLSFSY